MKYNVEFSCGHTAEVSLVGPHKDRESKIEWYSRYGLCPECYKKQQEAARAAELAARQEATEAAAENADTYGWPELVGSPKQVSWALQLRQEFYDKMCEAYPDEVKKFMAIIDRTPSASEWIDGRDSWSRFAEAKLKQVTTTPTASEQAQLRAESTVEPQDRRHPGTAEIRITGAAIHVIYPRDEEFRTIVKDLGYAWDRNSRCWAREVTELSGTVRDRAAELGSALLLAGYAIVCGDRDVRTAAINADYAPECKRWIMTRGTGKYAGWLAIRFPRGDDAAYSSARKIPGSRWDSGRVVIPISEYASVLDMASAMNYQISAAAQQAISDYEASVTVAVPADAPQPDEVEDTDVSDILNSSREVLTDLVDD